MEVPGSSPGWPTLKISNLEEIQVADFSFLENIGKTIGYDASVLRPVPLVCILGLPMITFLRSQENTL